MKTNNKKIFTFKKEKKTSHCTLQINGPYLPFYFIQSLVERWGHVRKTKKHANDYGRENRVNLKSLIDFWFMITGVSHRQTK